MQVRLMTPGGGVSEELYEIAGPVDRKHCVVVVGQDGARKRLHKERLLPADSLGKLVAVRHGDGLKTACPDCSRTLTVAEDFAECPIHGKRPTTSHEHLNGVNSQAAVTPEKEPTMAGTEATTINLTQVSNFGVELWTKPQVKFSDPRTDVQSHVLLADFPPRKLCFNTYNGTLGKRKKNKTDDDFFLQLQAFKDNVPVSPNGAVVYPLKCTLDDARERLTKANYTIRQSVP